MPLTLTCGADRKVVNTPLPLDSPLRDLRKIVADWTGHENFKLIHKGALMKDDNAPLSAYKIRPNSTVAVIGGPTSATISRSEQNTLSHINDELSTVRSTLVPALQSFVTTPTEKEHLRLSELLLQSLLRLDAITPDPTWESARRDRKAAVKEVQTYIDQLDEAWRSQTTVK
ncbi:hypothetical protein Moror_6762 [Moniliophthora roreri MCA 2997]|uniref:BAG domain-containing protein n=2 Tax=Moniliophthora roreri TaxID=221103 RepID=V2XS08_MONRO|nr:hypothetical protein Moror_6762 [Moniliophthora roreri MCA 2997]KAI3618624.1 hypothetical protein WG66_016549 [Moniliophthora roreri]